MLISTSTCLGPCAPTPICQFKILSAQIRPVDTPVANSYCPGSFTVTDGVATWLGCGTLGNLVNWLIAQETNFHNDSLYPWSSSVLGGASGIKLATFDTVGSTTPSSIVDTYTGSVTYGSVYASGGGLVPVIGPSAGGACLSAQIIALKMSGELFLVPLGSSVFAGYNSSTGEGTACLMSQNIPSCTGPNTYYVPMPPLGGGDGNLCDSSALATQIGYLPFQAMNTVDCLPAFSGSYVPCQTPDPFFGSDPP